MAIFTDPDKTIALKQFDTITIGDTEYRVGALIHINGKDGESYSRYRVRLDRKYEESVELLIRVDNTR